MKSIVTCLLLIASPMTAFAQDVINGRAHFENYCATCHGMDGRGAGPMAQVLTIKPIDLTQLSRDANGTFPVSYVIAKIDGRETLLSHGSPMPLFGTFFEGRGVTIRGSEGMLIMTSQPIVDLVTFLETLQDPN